MFNAVSSSERRIHTPSQRGSTRAQIRPTPLRDRRSRRGRLDSSRRPGGDASEISADQAPSTSRHCIPSVCTIASLREGSRSLLDVACARVEAQRDRDRGDEAEALRALDPMASVPRV